jgi:hypothetical protein
MEIKTTFYTLIIFLVLTNCNSVDKNAIGICCDKTYTNVDDALKCLSQTNDGNGTTTDERLLLIAFVDKDVEANQKLGWDIIKDQDIIKEAKRKYALVIVDVNQYKIPDNDCAFYMVESIRKNSGKTFFVIANQLQCWFGDWTLADNKESVIQDLGVGNGP